MSLSCLSRSTKTWSAYSCLACDCWFDVCLPNSKGGGKLNIARCPICGEGCDLEDSWAADEHGHNNRSKENYKTTGRKGKDAWGPCRAE